MKTRSVELAAHQALGSTAIARCWRFERRDGTIITVNNSARDLLILGELYLSKDGVTPTSLEQQATASVPNSEITGTLSADVSEAQIFGGLWDGAFVTIFEVNYRDLTQGRMILQTGTIGDLKVGRSTFNAETRGLGQALQQTIGDVYTNNCTATLGDARCKVALGPLTVAGAITGVTTRRLFADTGRIEAADWFGAGIIEFYDGLNAGIAMEIAEFTGGAFALVLPMPFNVVAGDTYTAVPGCRKRHARHLLNPAGVSDCIDKFNNILNFRGFPFVPGPDKMLGLGGTEGTNL